MWSRRTFCLATALAVLLVASCASASNTFTIRLPNHAEQCFTEPLRPRDRLDLSYEVEDGGSLDIDFVLYAPNSRPLHAVKAESDATFGFNAEIEGDYVYCFSNKRGAAAEKRVSFTVHGPDEKWKIEEREMKESIDDPTEHLQSEIRVLAGSIRAVRDEHAYLMQREKRHRKTAESTNSRVMFWSLVQMALLIAVCGFQITYLKRFFESRTNRSTI
ncbi:p24 complex component [Gaertneriomyces sp. JEL0708]|nr:p24 complex component [Gaertneriomyces sp. JEL0708]